MFEINAIRWALQATIVATHIVFSAAIASAAEPVRIGVSLGLTGKYESLALMQKRGYELWRDDVNTRGGMLGRPVELTVLDDESDPSVAIRHYRNFVDRNSVDHIFAPYSSELTEAIAPVVDKAGFPTLTPGAAAEKIWRQGYSNIFGMWMPASRYSQGMLRIAYEARLTSIAILHADDPFSVGIAKGANLFWSTIAKLAPDMNLQIVYIEGFAKDTADLTEYVARARDAGAELVIVAGHRDEAVNARRAAAGLNWNPRAFFATVGPALPEWPDLMGKNADGAFSTTIWEPHKSVTYPGSWEFTEAFRSRYGIDPSYHAATAYAAGQILEAAIVQVNSADREAVRAALFDLDTNSIIGRFAVDHTGMQIKRVEMILQWQKGRKEIVWPEDLRSANPVFGE